MTTTPPVGFIEPYWYPKYSSKILIKCSFERTCTSLSERKFHDITPLGLHIVFRNNIENRIETLLTKLKTYKDTIMHQYYLDITFSKTHLLCHDINNVVFHVFILQNIDVLDHLRHVTKFRTRKLPKSFHAESICIIERCASYYDFSVAYMWTNDGNSMFLYVTFEVQT